MPEILIADSTNASVTFSVLNMREEDQFLGGQLSSSLECTVRLFDENAASESPIIKVSAALKRDRVQCSSAFFNYSAPTPYQNYTLEFFKADEMIDKTSGFNFFLNKFFFSYSL